MGASPWHREMLNLENLVWIMSQENKKPWSQKRGAISSAWREEEEERKERVSF